MARLLRQEFAYELSISAFNEDSAIWKHLDVEVVKKYTLIDEDTWRPWPGKHKNVMRYYELANGKLVGHNENPGVGWSFPVMNKPKDW